MAESDKSKLKKLRETRRADHDTQHDKTNESDVSIRVHIPGLTS